MLGRLQVIICLIVNLDLVAFKPLERVNSQRGCLAVQFGFSESINLQVVYELLEGISVVITLHSRDAPNKPVVSFGTVLLFDTGNDEDWLLTRFLCLGCRGRNSPHPSCYDFALIN